jgi:hypothetical protein
MRRVLLDTVPLGGTAFNRLLAASTMQPNLRQREAATRFVASRSGMVQAIDEAVQVWKLDAATGVGDDAHREQPDEPGD